ncbi:tail fiber protein [Chromobacterium vaccinii]|uniref:tail fiber protein n=1 Tax=Chromobacterium vaccinii TaxID=1108595 RepID=UPI001E48A9C8|nr:tail fiber protein [Chromobacterium vaccinii]MCD4483059.1 tail fiber protein [Chromobacterium vaccinii]
MQDLKPINSPDSLFHDGNPATGELGTIVAADWLNSVQSAAQELLTVIKNSGQTPDSTRQDQLLQAVRNIAWGGNSKPTTLGGYGIAIASQTEAEAGSDNVKAMTPLRVEQALNAAGLSGYAKNITSGSLQTVRPNGLYHVDATGQVSGAPEKNNGMLLTNFLSDKWGSQVYWMWGGATYEQRLQDGSWQPWVKLLKTGQQSTLADYGITDGLPLKPTLSATDLNSITDSGIYHQRMNAQASSAPNYPIALAGILMVYACDGMVYQTYQTYNNQGCFYRCRYAGNWSPWQKLAEAATTLAGYGITDGASKTDLQKAVNDLVAGAPGALNTLQELAAALGNDANYAASITKQLSNKTDKATTLAGYGITDGASKSELQSISPAGQIAFFATTNAPTGWLFANGQPVLRANYPALFAAIGTTYGLGDGSTTFNLPDLQGQFIRGWDPNHKVDTDTNRAFGREQGDAIRNINGRFGHHPSIFVDDKLFKKVTMTGVSTETIAGNSPTSSQAVDFDASRTVPTANETRPRNVALLACIKC